MRPPQDQGRDLSAPAPSIPRAPAHRSRPAGRGRGWAWASALASLLLHALVAALFILWPDREQPFEPLPAPSYDLVFDSGSQAASGEEDGRPDTAAPDSPATEAAPPPAPPAIIPPPPAAMAEAPAPTPPTLPPAPAAPPAPESAPAPPLPSPPTPSRAPDLAQGPPAPAPPAPPAPIPPEAARPDPVLEALLNPPPPAPPLSLPPTLRVPAEQQAILPAPPVAPAAPPAAAPARPAPRPPLAGVWIPGAASLAQPTAPPGAQTRPGARGPMDLTLAPGSPLGRITPETEVLGAQVGADWRSAFRAWVDAHKRYPEAAALLGQQGVSRVEMIVEPGGQVRSVRLIGPSGSVWLDAGLVNLFRNANLPAFPPSARPDPNGVTIRMAMHYILVR